jgi:DNA-binding response OmpR family regulator
MITIAIVDDEVQILDMLEKFLKRNDNYSVTTFSNPVQAASSITNDKFDVALVDIMMPQMDGMELLEKIKNNNTKTSVIMMTAYSSLDKVLNSHKIGADHYVLKPFESLQLVGKKIEELTRR